MLRVFDAVGAAARAVRRLTRPDPPQRQGRWLGVTVLATPDEIAPHGNLPAPLRRLADRIEVRMEPAPGDRGTELYARPLSAPSSSGLARLVGRDALAPVRVALREAKALVETGEVVRSDETRTPHPGPAGKVLQAVDRGAMGAGRL